MLKISELQQKSHAELNNVLAGLRSKLFNLNFDATDKKVKDSSQIGKIRKDIARILTVLNMESFFEHNNKQDKEIK